jgi:hypothetical protein
MKDIQIAIPPRINSEKAIGKEFRVGMSVALGVPPKNIFNELGAF